MMTAFNQESNHEHPSTRGGIRVKEISITKAATVIFTRAGATITVVGEKSSISVGPPLAEILSPGSIGDVVAAMEALYQAGGHGWDDVADPEAVVRESRGETP